MRYDKNMTTEGMTYGETTSKEGESDIVSMVESELKTEVSHFFVFFFVFFLYFFPFRSTIQNQNSHITDRFFSRN